MVSLYGGWRELAYLTNFLDEAQHVSQNNPSTLRVGAFGKLSNHHEHNRDKNMKLMSLLMKPEPDQPLLGIWSVIINQPRRQFSLVGVGGGGLEIIE